MAEIKTRPVDDDHAIVTLPDLKGKGVIEYEIETPTPEQLILLATADNPATAVMTLLGQVFDEDGYTEIRRRLGLRRNDPARLQIDDLTTIVEQLMRAKTDFPTGRRSGSSSSPTPTGQRSTGRVRSEGLTHSDSVPAAS